MHLSDLCSEEEHVILSQINAGLGSDWLIEHGIWPESMTVQRKPSLNSKESNRFLNYYEYSGGGGSGAGSGIGGGTGAGYLGSYRGEGVGCGFRRNHSISRYMFDNVIYSSDYALPKNLRVSKSIIKIGKNYLFHVGNYFCVIGKVTEMACTGIWILKNASKVDMQNQGDKWHELAQGEDQFLREGARYWTYTGEVSISYLWVIEWKGKLPNG